MRTVHEVSRLTGVSIRTLHYYDRIGLLPPTEVTGADTQRANIEWMGLFVEFGKLRSHEPEDDAVQTQVKKKTVKTYQKEDAFFVVSSF